jgi:signal transduction histidine kinase
MKESNRNPRPSAKLEFLREVAHEFQTPIAILKANIEILARRNAAQGATREEIRAACTAQATLDRLTRLVRNLLDINAVAFIQNAPEIAPINLSELLQDTYEDCALLSEDRNVTLSFASEDVAVCGDRDKLKEVLLNLVSNALKHTPAGGLISLSARALSEKAEIVVSDSGTGIDPDHLPYIFERFYKIPAAGAVESHGIGLYLCRRIIEAHGGTIFAESKPGKGSRFTISIPLASHSPASTDAQRPEKRFSDIINE